MSNLFDRMYSKKNTMVNGSQMSWVGEQGTPASRLAQDDENALAKLDTQQRRLRVVAKHLKEINGRIAEASLLTKDARREVLASVAQHSQKLRDAKNLPHGMSASLRRLANATLSLKESYSVDTMSLAVLHARAAEDKCTELKGSAEGKRQALVTGATEIEDQLYERAREVLKRTATEVKRLDSLKNKSMAVARVPIVPILKKGFFKTAVLDRKGVHYDNIGGYVMLHNQIVLGINETAMRKTGRKTEKALDAARRLTTTLSKGMGTKVSIVSESGVHYNGGVWYWLAEDRMLDSLRDAAGGTLAVQSWGFGFQST